MDSGSRGLSSSDVHAHQNLYFWFMRFTFIKQSKYLYEFVIKQQVTSFVYLHICGIKHHVVCLFVSPPVAKNRHQITIMEKSSCHESIKSRCAHSHKHARALMRISRWIFASSLVITPHRLPARWIMLNLN